SFRTLFYPVYYVYPLSGNEAAVGYDLGSNQARLNALQTAMDTARPVMTTAIKLVQETATQSGVLIFYPVFQDGVEPRSIAERRRKLLGFALLVLRVGDLIEHASASLPQQLDLMITDTADKQVLYGDQNKVHNNHKLHFKTVISFAQRSWQLSVTPLAGGAVYRDLTAWLIALGALLLSLLASLHFYQLNRSHRQISLEVARQTKALRVSEQRFSLAVEGSSVGIWDWIDVDESNEYWSPQFYKLLGYENLEIKASKQNFVRMLHPEDRKPAAQLLQRHLTDRSRFEIEYRIKHKSGEYLWFLCSGQAAWDENGKALRMVGSIQKIQRRKKAEIAIASYAAELQRSNEDLEQFAYVASHDLKAPLRGISNLAQWIEENMAGKMDSETDSYMQLLKGRITRLENLLAGLLQYSKAGLAETQVESVDLNLLTGNITDLLCAEQQGFLVKFELPNIQLQQSVISQVLHNLISNSIKHHLGSSGKINVDYENTGSEHLFSVSDDGPGIDPAMSGKVFQMFQTLKPRDEVEGSGMGLAIVKKLIERSGGKVWIDRQRQQGCCIKFSLPIIE
ncbi:MAG: CHASE domain-containing protein, partial [Pseudomonadales bacterium]|nr:CHASE domain-containing protein [Pseudomonadales bacterium]